MTEKMSTSSSGGMKGVKEERYDLLPKPGLDAIARVFAFGAEKYASHNWRRGYEWGKSYAALQRHLTAFWEGETFDPESGLPHLGHAGFHILALLTWLEEQGEAGEFDDRYVPTHRAPIKDVDDSDDGWGVRQFGDLGKRRAEPVVDWRDPEPITLSGVVDSREALRRFFGEDPTGPHLHFEALGEAEDSRPMADHLKMMAEQPRVMIMHSAVDESLPLAHFVVHENGDITENVFPNSIFQRVWADEMQRQDVDTPAWLAALAKEPRPFA